MKIKFIHTYICFLSFLKYSVTFVQHLGFYRYKVYSAELIEHEHFM